MRRASLCQSAYSFALLVEGRNPDWHNALGQANEAFMILRAALQVINRGRRADHRHGMVRTLASIMQVQRFIVALSSFEQCQTHLAAALALFTQIFDSAGADESPAEGSSRFSVVMNCLGPPTQLGQTPGIQVPSAEQMALRFASSLLSLDDVIASTIRQEQRKLYKYHEDLLGSKTTAGAIKLEEVVGCQGWILAQVGEMAALDAWKKQHKEAGDLDVINLVQRASKIKCVLEDGLASLEVDHIQGLTIHPSDILMVGWPREGGGGSASQSLRIT